jgi:hypothetical protein
MIPRLCLVALVGLGLVGCGGRAASGSAADSASRLLAAAFKGDRIAFEAEIDRSAVREDVRRQVSALARATTLDVDGGPSDFALDRMISPAAIRLVHAGTGDTLSAAPTPAQVAPLMKAVDAKHACLRAVEAPDRCLLTFARSKDGWRLVGMQANGVRLQIELAAR